MKQKTRMPQPVAERCYEVYSALYGNRQSLAHLQRRGGFGAGEVVAFLYARSFPREEWRERANEVLYALERCA